MSELYCRVRWSSQHWQRLHRCHECESFAGDLRTVHPQFNTIKKWAWQVQLLVQFRLRSSSTRTKEVHEAQLRDEYQRLVNGLARSGMVEQDHILNEPGITVVVFSCALCRFLYLLELNTHTHTIVNKQTNKKKQLINHKITLIPSSAAWWCCPRSCSRGYQKIRAFSWASAEACRIFKGG